MSDFHGVRCDTCLKTAEGFMPLGWMRLEERTVSEPFGLKRHFDSFACLKTFVDTGVVNEPRRLEASSE